VEITVSVFVRYAGELNPTRLQLLRRLMAGKKKGKPFDSKSLLVSSIEERIRLH